MSVFPFASNSRKDKGRVIAHDFPDEDQLANHQVRRTKMNALRRNQPTTFQCSSCVLLCGRLSEDQINLTNDEHGKLEEFFRNAARQSRCEKSLCRLYRIGVFIKECTCCYSNSNTNEEEESPLVGSINGWKKLLYPQYSESHKIVLISCQHEDINASSY